MKLVELFNNYPNEVERKAKFKAFGTPNYSFVSNKKAKIYIGAWPFYCLQTNSWVFQMP